MTWTEGIFLARVNPRWGYQGCNWLVTRRGHDGAGTKETQSHAIHNRMPSLGDSDRVYRTRSAEPVPGQRSHGHPLVHPIGPDAPRGDRAWHEDESRIADHRFSERDRPRRASSSAERPDTAAERPSRGDG